MHLPKLFWVSLYLYTGIANASVLEKRKVCSGLGAAASCLDSNGDCSCQTISCHNYFLWQTCYCPPGGTVKCGAACVC